MHKKAVLSLVLLLFCFCLPVFAEESITITTYYPSPYGSYNELKTNKMAVGNTNAPDTSGVMRFEWRTSDPSGANDMQDGAMYYSSNKHEFRYYDGTTWKPVEATHGYVGRTTATYDGLGVGGYAGGNAKCAAAYPGSRMCVAADFANGLPTSKGWYNSFTIYTVGYTVSGDCTGWTQNLGVAGACGPFWNGYPDVTGCSDFQAILCCK